MKCLVFDIWGDYGHFRKFYTTSSPLTFSIPPRTTVCGIIAALIGLDKEEYLKYFTKDKCNIAIQLNKEVNKTRLSYNLINTKTAKLYSQIKDRTQVTFELLQDPSYRIYINHLDNEIYSKIKSYLEANKNYYTLSMGLSQFIAEFRYVKEIDLEYKDNSNEFVYINTAIAFDEDMEIQFEEGKEYFKDTMPNEMNEDRVVQEYKKVLFERNGLPISCKCNYYSGNEGEKLVFL
ncbi:MAG TPA: type I-B CRISPR-associated protein Cas5 [Clostridium sp.]|jgi:CRISPR-associated protein Cas5h|nr:type I-B CRISPR-associated protein Cas5 [Clostridia bacterium]HCW03798.1 type I-B CRISPR-associated protein Cas5 [Clostridium sp.]